MDGYYFTTRKDTLKMHYQQHNNADLRTVNYTTLRESTPSPLRNIQKRRRYEIETADRQYNTDDYARRYNAEQYALATPASNVHWPSQAGQVLELSHLKPKPYARKWTDCNNRSSVSSSFPATNGKRHLPQGLRSQQREGECVNKQHTNSRVAGSPHPANCRTRFRIRRGTTNRQCDDYVRNDRQKMSIKEVQEPSQGSLLDRNHRADGGLDNSVVPPGMRQKSEIAPHSRGRPRCRQSTFSPCSSSQREAKGSVVRTERFTKSTRSNSKDRYGKRHWRSERHSNSQHATTYASKVQGSKGDYCDENESSSSTSSSESSSCSSSSSSSDLENDDNEDEGYHETSVSKGVGDTPSKKNLVKVDQLKYQQDGGNTRSTSAEPEKSQPTEGPVVSTNNAASTSQRKKTSEGKDNRRSDSGAPFNKEEDEAPFTSTQPKKIKRNETHHVNSRAVADKDEKEELSTSQRKKTKGKEKHRVDKGDDDTASATQNEARCDEAFLKGVVATQSPRQAGADLVTSTSEREGKKTGGPAGQKILSAVTSASPELRSMLQQTVSSCAVEEHPREDKNALDDYTTESNWAVAQLLLTSEPDGAVVASSMSMTEMISKTSSNTEEESLVVAIDEHDSDQSALQDAIEFTNAFQQEPIMLDITRYGTPASDCQFSQFFAPQVIESLVECNNVSLFPVTCPEKRSVVSEQQLLPTLFGLQQPLVPHRQVQQQQQAQQHLITEQLPSHVSSSSPQQPGVFLNPQESTLQTVQQQQPAGTHTSKPHYSSLLLVTQKQAQCEDVTTVSREELPAPNCCAREDERFFESLESDFSQTLLTMVKCMILCSSCKTTFNRSVICHKYVIQLNSPIQCACGCVICKSCYYAQKGCRVHNVLSDRGLVNTAVSTLASCSELDKTEEWDLARDPKDHFRTEKDGHWHVHKILKQELAPNTNELKIAFGLLIQIKDTVSFRYWENEQMLEEVAFRYVCIPHVPGFWDHVLVGACPLPKTENMIGPDHYLPKLFNVCLPNSYRFHWCCFVLKKQVILAMWCTAVCERGRTKVTPLVDCSLRNLVLCIEFRRMVFYLSRWFTAQYVSPVNRELKVVLDSMPSEGPSLVHLIASLAHKSGMDSVIPQVYQIRPYIDLNYNFNLRIANNMFTSPCESSENGEYVNIVDEFNGYHNDSSACASLTRVCTTTEFYSYL